MVRMESPSLPDSGRAAAGEYCPAHSKALRLLAILLLAGCASVPNTTPLTGSTLPDTTSQDPQVMDVAISLVSHQTDQSRNSENASSSAGDGGLAGLRADNLDADTRLADPLSHPTPPPIDSLEQLEDAAVAQNPSLRRLAQQYQAARAKVRYVDGLPDPTMAANVFATPIETAAGSQRANLKVAQMLPWLPRLDAQAQQACFEAMALQQVHAAERLKVVGDVRTMWYRLYVLGKQIEIHEANQELLESLIAVANARVSTGKATQGDVLVGTLEYSKLEEQLVTLRQQHISTVAEIDRLVGRRADVAIHGPTTLDVTLPDWTHLMLRQFALEYQPDIAAARIRTQATRWGVTVAQLKRKPDFSLNASWFAIDNNRRPQPSWKWDRMPGLSALRSAFRCGNANTTRLNRKPVGIMPRRTHPWTSLCNDTTQSCGTCGNRPRPLTRPPHCTKPPFYHRHRTRWQLISSRMPTERWTSIESSEIFGICSHLNSAITAPSVDWQRHWQEFGRRPALNRATSATISNL